jgi:hypothetical protein
MSTYTQKDSLMAFRSTSLIYTPYTDHRKVHRKKLLVEVTHALAITHNCHIWDGSIFTLLKRMKPFTISEEHITSKHVTSPAVYFCVKHNMSYDKIKLCVIPTMNYFQCCTIHLAATNFRISNLRT